MRSLYDELNNEKIALHGWRQTQQDFLSCWNVHPSVKVKHGAWWSETLEYVCIVCLVLLYLLYQSILILYISRLDKNPGFAPSFTLHEVLNGTRFHFLSFFFPQHNNFWAIFFYPDFSVEFILIVVCTSRDKTVERLCL